MKSKILFAVVLLASFLAQAQQKQLPGKDQYVDFTATFGSSEGAVAFSYVYNWRLGKKKKFEAGLGLRWTTYWGTDKEFYTATARLARSTTTPFVIVFAGHEEQNIDTVIIQGPLTSSLNLSGNLGYNISSKWYVGVNIDLIGFTIGRNSSATLVSNGVSTTEPVAVPYHFNLLLTGDNDIGSLNSGFFISYHVTEKWSIQAVYQFFIAEYKTQNVKQIAPDGTEVNEFRNKANLFGLGISYNFN